MAKKNNKSRPAKKSPPAPKPAAVKKSAPVKPVKAAKPAKPARTRSSKKTQSHSPTRQRLWLMYPPKLIQEPLVWQLGQKFKVVTNIRQASVTDEIGIVCLEVNGNREAVKSAIKWLEKGGVNVEPVEINIIES